MKINPTILSTAKRKALQSNCRYKISALGFSRRNELIDSTTNYHRWDGKGKGLHAEMILMKRNPLSLKSIIICRVNQNGEFLPIDPCPVCSQKAKELSIKIYTIKSSD
jgi:hypothetical protein